MSPEKLCCLLSLLGSGLQVFFSVAGAGEAARRDTWVKKGHLFLRPWLKECSNRVGEEAGRDFQSFRALGDVSDRTPANCYWSKKRSVWWSRALTSGVAGSRGSVPSGLATFSGSVSSAFLRCPAAFPLASSKVMADIFPLSGTLSNPPNSEVPELNLTGLTASHEWPRPSHFCHGFAMLEMASSRSWSRGKLLDT